MITEAEESDDVREATQLGGRVGTIRSFERSQLQATTDGLTGLRNRRTLETEIRGLLNDGTQMSLVMADLDHFKLLKDTYGHEAGDRALRKFSQVVTATLRDSDIVGRYGGEEFVIAFPGAPTSAPAAVLDRLRAHLALAGEESDNPTFTASLVSSTRRSVGPWKTYCASPMQRCTEPKTRAATASPSPTSEMSPLPSAPSSRTQQRQHRVREHPKRSERSSEQPRSMTRCQDHPNTANPNHHIDARNPSALRR